MLSRTERLTTADFKKRPVRQVPFRFGTVKFLPISGSRAAVVVSKKVCPTAPARNRLRRRVYSALRPLIRTGVLRKTIVVYPNRAAAEAAFSELQAALETATGSPR